MERDDGGGEDGSRQRISNNLDDSIEKLTLNKTKDSYININEEDSYIIISVSKGLIN